MRRTAAIWRRFVQRAHVVCAPRHCLLRSHALRSLENKAFSALASDENYLHARVRVICCAPNRVRRSIFSAATFFNEESSNGKERWRTDEVGNRGSDLQGRRAVPQAGCRGVRVAQRPDQEEPAWRWPVHAARPAQAEG